MFLELEALKNMPHVVFDHGVLTIEGRSIPHESSPYFEPLIKLLSNYCLSPEPETRVNIKIDYINSDSMRSLMNVLILIEKLHANGNAASVNWYYTSEDDVIFDAGSIFQSLLELPITLNKME